MAYESVSLYGLVLVEKHRVSYSKIDPKVSREVFIREALVEGLYRGKGKFNRANEALIAELDKLEAKSRRRDLWLMIRCYMNSLMSEYRPMS